MNAKSIEVVPPAEPLRSGWRALYDGYATFYEREMTDAIADAVWSWIGDPAHELEGRIALVDGEPGGLAHFRRMPSPLRGADIGFLDDLFVRPDLRGRGIADALFDALAAIARERGWQVVRWITADDNYRARAMYDRIATKTMWNTYELKI